MANDPSQPQLADTLSACCKSIGVCAEYIKGTEYTPHYPVPAIPAKHTQLVNLGYVSALNGFNVDIVFDNYVKL